MDNKNVKVKQEPELTIIEDNPSVAELPQEPPIQLKRRLQQIPVICKICKKGFREEDFPVHYKLHGVENYCTNCYREFNSFDELVLHQVKCQARLRKIEELQNFYREKKVCLTKTSLLCVVCKDTLFETDCDDKLHCFSCVPSPLDTD